LLMLVSNIGQIIVLTSIVVQSAGGVLQYNENGHQWGVSIGPAST